MDAWGCHRAVGRQLASEVRLVLALVLASNCLLVLFDAACVGGLPGSHSEFLQFFYSAFAKIGRPLALTR